MIYLFKNKRRLLLVFTDICMMGAAFYLSYLIRFDAAIPSYHLQVFLHLLPLIILVRVCCFVGFGLYRGMWSYASISDLLVIGKAVTAGSCMVALIIMLSGVNRPSRGVFLLDWLLAFLFAGGVRLSYRLWCAARLSRQKTGAPVIIIGAGLAGEMVIRELQALPNLKRRPVGLLDDDTAKHGLRIHGVPVLGAIADVKSVAEQYGVDEVIIAIPSAGRGTIRSILEKCRRAGLRMKTIPGLQGLLAGSAKVSEVRDVRLEDLLQREPARLDVSLIRDFLRNRRILVTGAGGSIGSEICRQAAVCDPASLVLLDRAENSLFEIDAEIGETFPALNKAAVLADIKHTTKMEQVFERYRPEIVFDAAAFKHVPLMESHPEEAVLNNIVATRRLVETAIANGTYVFLLISTDKAVNPSSVMGATKRAAERYLMALMSTPAHGRTICCAVRFGNVLGSNGSVVPTFRRQMERGGPITVTHPEVTRYFMTIPEAVQLVLRAATLAAGGEIFVLDMGEPVKIIDLARDLVRLSGLEPDRDIQISVTGLRPGEKLTEELWYPDENVGPTPQDKLLVARQAPNVDYWAILSDIEDLERHAIAGTRKELYQALRRLVPEYRPAASSVQTRPRVLVADDDPEIRSLVRAILQDTYDVMEACDGSQAVSLSREELPDLVLLDLKMPRGNGYHVCQALRADHKTRNIPIIMLTALSDVTDKVRGIDLGADDYITKPFQVEELQARIHMVLRRAYAP